VKAWLGFCAFLPLVTATAAQAQLRKLAQIEGAGAPPTRTVHFSIPAQAWVNAPAPFAGGVVTTDEMGPNTMLGVGLVRMRGRKRDGSDLRTGAPAAQRRNPAVTFVVKF
jgi:hypothetical protein